jgi:DNA-binding beta-propeller fold protein YncE
MGRAAAVTGVILVVAGFHGAFISCQGEKVVAENAATREAGVKLQTGRGGTGQAPDATEFLETCGRLKKYLEQVVWHVKGMVPGVKRGAEWRHLTPEQMPDYYLRTMQAYAEKEGDPTGDDGFMSILVYYAATVGERLAKARLAGQGELGIDIKEFERYRRVLETLAGRREALGDKWEEVIVPTLEQCYGLFASMAWRTEHPEVRAMFESLKPKEGSPLMKGWREAATMAGYFKPEGLEFSIETGKDAKLERVAMSPDGKRVAVAAEGKKQVQVWDLEKRVLVKAWDEADEVEVLAWVREGKEVRWASRRAFEDVGDATPMRLKVGSMGEEGGPRVVSWEFKDYCRVAFDAKGGGAAVEQGEAVLLLDREGKEIGKLMHSSLVKNVALTSDGRHLAVTTFDEFAVWGLPAGKKVWSVKGDVPVQIVREAVLSGDGRVLVTVEGKALKRWEVASGKLLSKRAMDGPENLIERVAVSADGKWVVLLNAWESGVQLMDGEFKTIGPLWQGHFAVNDAVFSGDGGRVISVGSDGRIMVWRVLAGMEK